MSRLPSVPDVPALVRALATGDPTRPRLTWYGPDGERIELSGKVLDNWVAKTANLLVDELDAGPGSLVAVDLPAHWRAAVWLLGCWTAGCGVLLVDPAAGPPAADDVPATDDAEVAVWVTDRPDSAAARAARAGGAELVAVALPALARGFGPGLPDGALDAAIEVRNQGDVFVPVDRPAEGDPALLLPDRTTVRFGELLVRAAAAAAALGPDDGVRLLVGGGPERAVEDLLAPLLRDGSVVLHHDLAGLAAETADRLLEQEQATRR